MVEENLLLLALESYKNITIEFEKVAKSQSINQDLLIGKECSGIALSTLEDPLLTFISIDGRPLGLMR